MVPEQVLGAAMPHFSIKSLLIFVAIVALWLSTSTGYRGSDDVQAIIRFFVFVSSGFALVYSSGRRRAFWGAFFAAMLMIFFKPNSEFMPSFLWVRDMLTHAVGLPDLQPIHTTPDERSLVETRFTGICGALQFSFATLAGFIAAYIYDLSQQDKDG